MPKPRQPIKGSKQTTDPAAIAWRNLSRTQKNETYGREFFMTMFNAGLLNANGKPTGRAASHRRTTSPPKTQQIEPTE